MAVDNFIVSARKYRPATFESVVGQQHITNTLKNAIKNNQLAQAFLFCGPRGVGKTTCARILAKTINCENLQPNGEAFHRPAKGILLRRLIRLDENWHLVGQPFHGQEIGVAQRLE